MKWNKDEKEREPKKDSLEERMRVRNKIRLRNQEVRPVNNLQWGEITRGSISPGTN